MGFISNPDEERYMNKPASQTQMAQAIVDAFGVYTHRQAVKKVEKPTVDTIPSQPDTPSQPSARKPAKPAKPEKPQTLYAVQVCASRTILEPNDPKLQGQPCDYVKIGEWYKYYTAADPDRTKVEAARKELRSLFPDCWIIKVER